MPEALRSMWGVLAGPGRGARERGGGCSHLLHRCHLPARQPVLPAGPLLCSGGCVPSAWVLAWGASYRVLRRSFWGGHCCGGRCGHPDPSASRSTLCRSHHTGVLGLTRRGLGRRCRPEDGLGLQAKAAKARGAVRAPPGEAAASRSVAAESNHPAWGAPRQRASCAAQPWTMVPPASWHTFSILLGSSSRAAVASCTPGTVRPPPPSGLLSPPPWLAWPRPPALSAGWDASHSARQP